MGKKGKPREPERCDSPELHAWYAAIHNRLKSQPGLPAGEVIASWLRVARPMVRQVPEPSREERRQHPGRYVRTQDGKWLTRLREVAAEYDGPLADEPDVVMYLDRVVPAIRVGSRIVHDRESALAGICDDDPFEQLARDLLPSGRAFGARKGVHSDTLARALLLWSLSLGGSTDYQRPAARCVIVWDVELNTGLGDPDLAALAHRFQALDDDLASDDHRRRKNAEAAVITASRRIWKTIGLRPHKTLRI